MTHPIYVPYADNAMAVREETKESAAITTRNDRAMMKEGQKFFKIHVLPEPPLPDFARVQNGRNVVAGTRQKPIDQLVNRRGGRGDKRLVVTGGPKVVPAPPAGLSKYAVQRWKQFWDSDVAAAVDVDSDAERLYRWVEAIDAREKVWRIVMAEPLVINRNRETVKHPLWPVLRQLTDEIQRAEEAFGMTPLSRFRLQFTKTEAAHSLEDLMAKLSKGEADIIDLDALEA